MVNSPDDEGIEFPISEKDFGKIEKKNKICISVMKIIWFNLFMYQI